MYGKMVFGKRIFTGHCHWKRNHSDGYFTVLDTPDHPYFLEEHGANILQCPRHDTWLHRCRGENTGDSFGWRCRVEGCDYTRTGAGRL